MTRGQTETEKMVPIKNVAAFMAMATRLVKRDPHLPGIGVCHGPSGYGKTCASIYCQNKMRAIHVEVRDSCSRRSFLAAILHELGERPKKRATISEMADEASLLLADDMMRPLIIDEADKLVDKGMIEIVRELYERSHAPVILVGEETLPAKLLQVERVHNRVFDWFSAQPCDLDDTSALAGAFVPSISIADDLLETICLQSGGRARRIVVNLARVAEFARNKRLQALDLKTWGGAAFFTGAPPAARHVELYKRVRSA